MVAALLQPDSTGQSIAPHPPKLAKAEWGDCTSPLPGCHDDSSMAMIGKTTLGSWNFTPYSSNEEPLTVAREQHQDFHHYPAVRPYPVASVETTWEGATKHNDPSQPGRCQQRSSPPLLGYPQRLSEEPGLVPPPSRNEAVSPFPCQSCVAEIQLMQKAEISFKVS